MVSRLVVLAVGALTLWGAQPLVDDTRRQRQLDDALAFTPSPVALRVAASGFDETTADLLWIRTVLLFGERYDQDHGGEWPAWLHAMIDATTTLDPAWRTPYHYGGGMLRVAGDIPGSTQVYERGAANLPNEPWFPFSVGMNHYLYARDGETAARWIAKASALPGAPAWWGAAAAAMIADDTNAAIGLRFIEEELATATTPGEREALEAQRARLQHDALVESWADLCRRYYADTGAPLPSPQALAVLGVALPEEPRGGHWVVGADGVVRSAAAEKDRRAEAIGRERALVRAP